MSFTTLNEKIVKSEMIYEMKLIEYSNPMNRTYSNKNCGGGLGSVCKTGFIFCLVDLPFRNPQNCSLGDYTTPILGGNSIVFNLTDKKNVYRFPIHKLPSVRPPNVTFVLSNIFFYLIRIFLLHNFLARYRHDDRGQRLL